MAVSSFLQELLAFKMVELGRRLRLQLQAQAGVARTRPLPLSLLPSGGHREIYRAMCNAQVAWTARGPQTRKGAYWKLEHLTRKTGSQAFRFRYAQSLGRCALEPGL